MEDRPALSDEARSHAYETLVRNFPNGAVILFDADLRHTVADGVGLAALGGSKETLEGATVCDAFPAELADLLAPAYRAALGGHPREYELALEERVHSLHVLPLRDPGGAIVAGMLVTQDITARKQAENERDILLLAERLALGEAENARRELSAQNARLRELDLLKDEFLALVSHELRTPLTSIIGYLEYLVDGKVGELDEEQMRMLRVIERNANRLVRLVSDLLLVAQVEAGKLALSIADADLREVARACVEAARPAAETKGLDLRLVADAPAPLRGDGARLAQLTDNLISNAVKFTPPGGRVDVRVRVERDAALLEVEDSGPGIASDEQEQLFERFFRARAASRDAIPGSGLGLAIAKALAEAHGGRIGLESEVCAGTTFRVSLPLDGRETEPGRAAQAGTRKEAA